MDHNQAKKLCDSWLPAWTGGKDSVERLLTYYAERAFYLDPANPEGLTGRVELRRYFEKLLRRNPDWYWEAEEIIPTERGFTLKWKAGIPSGADMITVKGLDIVEVVDGLISRNEVYFDRSLLVTPTRGR